jgi:hypothetical protein
MASSVSVANKNKADIRDENEYKIPKWLVLKFHGSGHLPLFLSCNYHGVTDRICKQKSRLKCACFLYKIHVTLQCIVVSALKKRQMCIRLFLKPFLYFNILSITWQLLLSVKWRHLFPWQIKTRLIYGMETNIKSRNGWF